LLLRGLTSVDFESTTTRSGCLGISLHFQGLDGQNSQVQASHRERHGSDSLWNQGTNTGFAIRANNKIQFNRISGTTREETKAETQPPQTLIK
jgi:hypothetical protein